VRYTTIVRTRFPSFQNPQACAQDIAVIRQENPDLAEIFSSCNKILHVDNITPVYGQLSEQLRNIGHISLTVHLQSCNQLYRPQNLDELNSRIQNYQTEREKVQLAMKDLEDKIKDIDAKALRDKANFETEMRNLEKQRVEEINRLNHQMAEERQREKERLDRLYTQLMEEQRRAREESERQMAEAQARLAAQQAEAQNRMNELQNHIINNTGHHIQQKSPGFFEKVLGGTVDFVVGGIGKVFDKVTKGCIIQ